MVNNIEDITPSIDPSHKLPLEGLQYDDPAEIDRAREIGVISPLEAALLNGNARLTDEEIQIAIAVPTDDEVAKRTIIGALETISEQRTAQTHEDVSDDRSEITELVISPDAQARLDKDGGGFTTYMALRASGYSDEEIARYNSQFTE